MGNNTQANGKKKGPSWRKKLNGWLHLWLGLASGIIVFIVALTGCIFVFQKEINEWVHHDIMFVTPTQQPTLPLTILQEKAQTALGKEFPVLSTFTYRQPDRAWEFITYKDGDENALTLFGTTAYYKMAYVNPYTGQVTAVRDMKKDFFVIVKYLHWSLLLNDKYGQPIVGWSTFIFVILLITGLILWWPKKWSKKAREQSFKIKWSGNFKRVNYDLHNVLGFYAMVVALVIALTGMVWAFKWFQTTVYVVASRSVTPPKHKEVTSDTLALPPANVKPLDIAYATAVKQFPKAKRIGVRETPAANTATIRMFVYWGKETYYDYDALQFDKTTGKLLLHETAKDKNAGEKLIGMNYDIHVGAIAGLPGKILAFFASLICASLPVTGFLVWWNKGRKEKKDNRHNKQHHKKVHHAQTEQKMVADAAGH
ncbi:PepSY-associated TM helix domain-containing protein [Chitinophaga pinensis]|uniref:PepSY domain-containing protein n=1 Tax=Chitinophaga pinensis TaxID=79329 RepID=A0A5C6LZ18_9BACT|nr:PepSY-associated TM helix domain-containing protein [Chitinophaga pinensis]TWW00656.1 PepSY domain-containing protein [Chitinophaga pinensis]